MKYYEIDAQLAALYAQIEENEGELSLEQFEALKTLEMERENKIEQFVFIHNQKKNEIEFLKHKKKELDSVIKKREDSLERFKEFLKGFLGGEKWSNGVDRVYYSPSVSVNVTDIDLIPNKYIRKVVKEETNPDKKLIKQAIENGEEIEGAELINKTNIIIQ